MISRFNPFADSQRARASADATSSTPTPRQTPAPSNQVLEPLLNRRTDPSAEAQMAVRGNNAGKLLEVLRQHPQLLTQPFGDKADTLLTEAARTGKSEAVGVLVMEAKIAGDSSSFSAFVNRRNTDGRNALALAVEHGKPDLVQMLLKHDEVASGNVELTKAIRLNQPRVAQLLVKHGPGTASTSEALSDASRAAYLGNVNELKALLDQNPELLTKQFGKRKETLLTEAARAGENDSVQAILMHALLVRPSSFADIINHRNTDGDTALAQAIQRGRLDVVTSLMKYAEADVTLANERGQAPLHHAARAEDPEFAVRLLRHKEIQAGQTDRKGNTPLHLAIDWGRSGAAVKIAGHPTAAPDHVNNSGQSALKMAINSKDLLVIDTLLKHPQVDPDRTDSRGRTLLWQEVTNWRNNMLLGQPESDLPRWSHILGKLAASPRVNANRYSPEGETPLTYLSKLSCPWDIGAHVEFNQWRNKTVKAMLDGSRQGAGQLDPNAPNAKGETPYEVALAAHNTSLLQIFDADAEVRRARRPSGQ